MKRLMSILITLGVMVGLCNVALAHYPEGVTYYAVEIPDTVTINFDGNLDEWNWVPEEYVWNLDNAPRKSQRIIDGEVTKTDFDVPFLVFAWSPSLNMLVFAVQVVDNALYGPSENIEDSWQEDNLQWYTDPDHNGGWFRDAATNSYDAQQNFYTPKQDGHIGLFGNPSLWWEFDEPHCHWGQTLDPATGSYTLEVGVTLWDWLEPDSLASIRHNLEAGQTVGFTFGVWDKDSEGEDKIGMTFHYEDPWADANLFTDLYLAPSGFPLGRVVGTVTESHTGSPYPGRDIKLFQVGGLEQATRTDGAGRYRLLAEAGTYDITASAPDAAADTAYAITVAAGDTTEVNFILTDLLGPELWNIHVGPVYSAPGDAVEMWTHLQDDFGIASVTAVIQSPDGNEIAQVPLSHWYTHSDGSQEFGTEWSAPTDLPRDYNVDIVAEDNLGNVSTYDNAYWFTTARYYRADAYIGTPAIDGNPGDGVWQGVDWHYTDLWCPGQNSFSLVDGSVASKQFRFKVLYDEDNIYLLTEERDDLYVPYPDVPSNPGNLWEGDNIMLGFETDHAHRWAHWEPPYPSKYWELYWTLHSGTPVTFSWVQAGGQDPVPFNSIAGNSWLDGQTGETVTIFELALGKPEPTNPGAVWGFSAGSTDNDGSGYVEDRLGMLGWSTGLMCWPKFPAMFGDLYFTGEPAPVLVTIPDTTAAPGASLWIPLYMSDVTGFPGIYSAQMVLSFDPTVLEADTVSLDGTLAQNWVVSSRPDVGLIEIALAGTDSLEGAGALAYVRFQAVGSVGDSTVIHFDELMLNEGQPGVVGKDGQFWIPLTPPKIAVDYSLLNFASVRFGTSRDLTLTVFNQGGGDLWVSDISSDNSAFSVDTTSFVVSPGDSQVATVTFSPTGGGHGAVFSGTLTIASNDSMNPSLEVELLGRGAELGISPNGTIFKGLVTIEGETAPLRTILEAYRAATRDFVLSELVVEESEGVNYALSIQEGQGGIQDGDEIAFRVVTLEGELLRSEVVSGDATFEAGFPPVIKLVDINGIRRRQVVIPTVQGYNSVSWNVIPEVDSVAVIFGDLIATGKVEVILAYNNDGAGNEWFDYYIPPLGEYNPLQRLKMGEGYFVKLYAGVEPDSLVVEGNPVDPQMPLPLVQGYNSVAYLPDGLDSLVHALGSLDFSKIEVVLGYNNDGAGNEWFDYYIPPLGVYNPLQIMESMRGYFIKLYSGQQDTLIYPETQLPIGVPKAVAMKGKAPWIKGSVMAMVVYGVEVRIEGELIPQGSIITAVRSGGEICGVGEVKAPGKFGMVIYGDVPFTRDEEGAKPGEQILFYLDGRLLSEKVVWRKFGEVVQIKALTYAQEAEATSSLPEVYSLSQNFPNPFNAETLINYQLPKAGRVILSVYNTAGQRIRTLVDDEKQAGYYTAGWDGRDAFGRRMATGVYLYQMQVADFKKTKKLILLR